MNLLKPEQLFQIEKKIIEIGISYQPLQEELIDHIACLIEKEMENGATFREGFSTTWTYFKTESDLLEIQNNTLSLLTYKKNNMNSFIWYAAASVIGLVFFSVSLNLINPSNENENIEYLEQIEPIEQLAKPVFAKAMDPPSRSPLNDSKKITSEFGMRYHPILQKRKMHRGVDFKAPMGTPVYATADGVIEKVQTHTKYGKLIVITHDDNYQSLYAQLSSFEIKQGQKVKKGDLIGKTGNSGLSTGPHLHYEVLKNGEAVDPVKYF